MATAYHRDQSGAPALTYSTSDSIDHFSAFKTILKACLVEGYGSTPAAGWELVEENANLLILRSGSHSGYICFSHASTAVTVSMCDVYMGGGVSGGVIVGEGAVSGTIASSAVPHKLMVRSLVRYATSSSWALIADDKTCIILMACAGTSSTPVELTGNVGGDPYAVGALYFGEDSNGNFIACGGENTTATGSSAAVSGFSDKGFTSLRNPSTGLLVDTGGIYIQTPMLQRYSGSYSQAASPLPVAYLTPFSWVSAGTFGDFRGICTDVRSLHNYPSYGAAMLGYTGDYLTSRTFNTPIPLDEENTYFVAPRHAQNSAFFLATDNPVFW